MHDFDELDDISDELNAQADRAADAVMRIIDRKKAGRQRPGDWEKLMQIFDNFQRDRVDKKFSC